MTRALTSADTVKSPWLLAGCALLCAVCAYLLLDIPAPAAPSDPPRPARDTTEYPGADGAPHPGPGSGSDPTPAQADATATAPTATARTELPPRGEGPSADRAIQRALEQSWPADLKPDDQHELLRAGRSLLRADATGQGHDQWPTGHPLRSDGVVAPAFTRFRIQAAIARRGTGPRRAVVHLVWAGADRAGTYSDGRVADLHFTRTAKKGGPTWVPSSRT